MKMSEMKKPYEFKEFTLEVDEEDIKKDIRAFNHLDRWVKRGLEVPDASLMRTINL